MSDVVGKKFYNAEQPSGSQFKILNAGASIALGTQTVGNDSLAEFSTPVVGNAKATTTTAKGFVTVVTDSLAESVTVTVV